MEQRKVVTVLFCDVVGSTALGETVDPEALRALLARYFERMKQIVERHGGVVEKFIGDAVMAVFGVPAVHEDDAVRALRAAAEMREAFGELGVDGRIGVNTGEVVTGTEERLATGDAVNVAARLQQAADAGEILLGETTVALVGDVAEIEPVPALDLKGKSGPVASWRLVSVAAETPERRFDSPLLGRARELELLEDAWRLVRTEQRCELVTPVGMAGVGKSRLVAEFSSRADGQIVRARCLSYGEDITYWPVVEVVKQLSGHPAQLDAAASKALAGLLGDGGDPSTDEIAWAFRKLLEAVARKAPLIAVFDDIQWAADAFLDLLEHIAVSSTEAPILLLCMARPELLDRRPGWEGVLRLHPLGAAEVNDLIDARIADLDSVARERIVEAAGGNPLFVEEMTAMLRESGGREITVPPTIHALLAARLDQLQTNERAVLEHGAIEGEVFHRGGVQALTPEESQLTTRLTALVRRELVRPDRPLLPGDDAYRFRHLLIRDAAYEATPKARRAMLHEQFAHWLDEHAQALVEIDELIGYHLEQAVHYLRELGRTDEADALARAAAARLRAAGGRALVRNDLRAGAGLLNRVAALLPADEFEPLMAMELAWCHFNVGDPEEATGVLERAAGRAAAAGRSLDELKLRLEQMNYEAVIRPKAGAVARLRQSAAEAEAQFEAAGDQLGLSVTYGALVIAEDIAGRSRAAMAAAAERLGETGRRSGHRLFANWGEQQAAVAHRDGPTPVDACLEWIERNPGIAGTSLGLSQKALLLAMLGRFTEAHELLGNVREWLVDRGLLRALAFNSLFRAEVAGLEGAAGDALDAAQEACDQLDATGDEGNRMHFYAVLAAALHGVGRDEDAQARLQRSAGTSDELVAQISWEAAQGLVLAARDPSGAEQHARTAVDLAGQTDMLNMHGDALLALAEVRRTRGADPTPELERALELYEQKGNLVMAERVRGRLTDQSVKLL